MSDRRLSEALALLGLGPGDPPEAARTRYRELMRQTHPDVAGAGVSQQQATDATVDLTAAFEIVAAAIAEHGCIPEPSQSQQEPTHTEAGPCRHRRPSGPIEQVEIHTDGDTISLAVPLPEAFAILLDAGSRIGGIGYVDRSLGILELIVRFEGGPSCSVLMTLQGRAFGTDAFVTMESIEAAPTPPMEPVMEALRDELRALHLD